MTLPFFGDVIAFNQHVFYRSYRPIEIIMTIFLTVCLVLSLVGMFTTKQVSEFIGPKGSGGLGDFLRVGLSVLWFTLGQLFCLILALVFALGLALLH